MTRPYVLCRGAAADLRSIARYTVQTWGETRSVAYVADLEAAASEVARGQGVFKELDGCFPACVYDIAWLAATAIKAALLFNTAGPALPPR